MKKTLFMVAVAALALSSCSNEEPIKVNEGRAIDFRASVGTRSAGLTSTDLENIWVEAYAGNELYFNALQFTLDKETNTFKSNPEYHWPGDGSQLTFWAYAPNEFTGTLSIASDGISVSDFEVEDDMADHVDLVMTKAVGDNVTNENGLELSMPHALSMIEIQGKSTDTYYTFLVTGVRIGYSVAKGSLAYNGTTFTWTPATGTKKKFDDTYDTPITLNGTAQSLMGEKGNAILLPQQLIAWDRENDATNAAGNAYLSVKLEVQDGSGKTVFPYISEKDKETKCMWASIPINTNWRPGYKYTYVLDFSNGAGHVDPEDPQPGKPVLGGKINISVVPQPWVEDPDFNGGVNLPLN